MSDPITSTTGTDRPVTVDPSDRKFYLQSPEPGALERFDAALKAQTNPQSLGLQRLPDATETVSSEELRELRTRVDDSIPALREEVEDYKWSLAFGSPHAVTLPPGYLDALSELSEREQLLEDIDQLLTSDTLPENQLQLENRIREIDAEIETLNADESSLEEEVDSRSPPRDYTGSPPSTSEALHDQNRQSFIDDLDELTEQRTDLIEERSQIEKRLDDRDPDEFNTISRITFAHAETVLRVDELREHTDINGNALNPDNTLFMGGSTALGTVYLNDDNRQVIEQYAEQYDIPPALLAGVVAAELDFDYEGKNDLRDGLTRAGINIPDLGIGLDDSIGATNVHQPTLQRAQQYLEENNLPGSDAANDYPVADDRYRATLEGSIEAAAIATAMYDDLYGGAQSPEDMAVVWAAYRSGVGGFDRNEGSGGFVSVDDFQSNQANGANAEFPMGNNAYMSEPLFEYLVDQYSQV